MFIAIGAVIVLAAAGVGGYFWLKPGDEKQPTPPADQIAIYDYSFTRPDGWEQTGGAAPDRQVLLQPIDRKNSDSKQPDARIAVQEQTLKYNSDSDRTRALSELKNTYQQRKEKGDEVADFSEDTTFAGKSVVHYREVVGTTGVDWYIQFAGEHQVSVGCQATETAEAQVRTACEQVVRSLVIKS